jgi:steroid delta-isomerase-like uncharacterized protein
MTDLDRLRLDAVNEHLRCENAHDFEGAIAVFGEANYDVVPTGERYDGPSRVNDFLSENATAFPDFRFESSRIAPTVDAVLVEGRFRGTHLGPWRGLPPTGRTVDFEMCLIFAFDGERMVSEKLYFDVSTALRQLGVADDPNSARGKLTTVLTHPIVIAKAVAFSLRHRSPAK